MPHIQDPTIGRSLQRGLRLTALPDSILAPEVVPVIVVDDYTTGRFGEIERACTGFHGQAAVAGENAHVSLQRSAIGTEVIVTRITLDPGGAAGRFFIGRITAANPGGAVSTETSFDDFNTPGKPSAQMIVGTVLPGGLPALDIMYQIVLIGNTHTQIPVYIRLGAPGLNAALLWVNHQTAGVAANIGFNWIERPPLG